MSRPFGSIYDDSPDDIGREWNDAPSWRPNGHDVKAPRKIIATPFVGRLELKRAGEILSEPQEAFQLWCIRRGVPYSVAFSFDQALAFLDALGCLRIRIGGER